VSFFVVTIIFLVYLASQARFRGRLGMQAGSTTAQAA
jgi:hypothetical protein